MAGRCRQRCTGWRPQMRSRPKYASTIISSPAPTLARTATSWPISTRTRLKSCLDACWNQPWPPRRSAKRCSSNALAISAPTQTRHPDAGVQPDRWPARYLGQGPSGLPFVNRFAQAGRRGRRAIQPPTPSRYPAPSVSSCQRPPVSGMRCAPTASRWAASSAHVRPAAAPS